MKVFGSISRLVSILFRANSQDITLEPNQGTTYTAARAIQLPPEDANAVLVSADSTQTLSNKTISGASNTLSNISLTASVTGVLPVANGGTNSSTTLNNNRVIQSSGGALVEAAAITAARALISDANGIPTQSATTSTELGYVSGVTSAIQTQLNGKVAKAGDTMTGSLILANQTALQLQELTSNGTNTTSLLANASIASSHSYTFPGALPGTSGFVLASDTSGNLSWVSNSALTSFKATWLAADGATKTVTHNLGSQDVIVQLYDNSTLQTIEVDTVVRTDANTVTLTSSETPAVSWRVLILPV